MAAPKGNTNSLKHGGRSIVLGSLPDGCSYITKITYQLQRELLQAYHAQHGAGEIPQHARLRIATAVRHERHALLATKWLRDHAQDMKPAEKLQFAEAIAKASESRDRALSRIGLIVEESAKPDDPFADLYSPQAHFGQAQPPGVISQSVSAAPRIRESDPADQNSDQPERVVRTPHRRPEDSDPDFGHDSHGSHSEIDR